MSEEDSLKIHVCEEIVKTLRAFNYTTAYTGVSFSRVKQGSYVRYGEITAKIGELNLLIHEIKKKYGNVQQNDIQQGE